MTDDDTRLDARVRRALATLPTVDDVDTRDALQSVLERSESRRGGSPSAARRWTGPVAAAVAVAAVAATVALGAVVVVPGPEPDRAPPLAGPTPSTISGSWERRVPASRADEVAGGWSMTLASDGVLRLSGPDGAPSAEGASYSTEGTRLRVDAFVNNVCAELPAGTYEWLVSSDALTLAVVDDPCPARADLLVGTWRPVP